MADPRRMTPEEHGEAHALLVKAVTDPDWQAASQALDDLMDKLLVVQRLLGPRSASPSASREVTADGPQALLLVSCQGQSGRPRSLPRPGAFACSQVTPAG
jgi:hypothetical protein